MGMLLEFPLSEAIVPNTWLTRGQFFKVLQNCCKNIIARPFRTRCTFCTKVCRTIEKQAPNGKSNSARSLFWLYHTTYLNRKISVIFYSPYKLSLPNTRSHRSRILQAAKYFSSKGIQRSRNCTAASLPLRSSIRLSCSCGSTVKNIRRP